MCKLRILSALFALLFCGALSAQDVISTKDGREIEAKVLEVGTEELVYKKWSRPLFLFRISGRDALSRRDIAARQGSAGLSGSCARSRPLRPLAYRRVHEALGNEHLAGRQCRRVYRAFNVEDAWRGGYGCAPVRRCAAACRHSASPVWQRHAREGGRRAERSAQARSRLRSFAGLRDAAPRNRLRPQFLR